MGAAKKQKPPSPVGAWLRGLLPWLLNYTGIVLILVVLLAVLGRFVLWPKLKDQILAGYRIGPAQVEITPQPPWISQSDIRAEVFRNPKIGDSLSLMDDDLADRLAEAFARHPWVARTPRPRVTKQVGSVKVELVYRKPVCMVEVPPGGYFLPVDAEGVQLPVVDFPPPLEVGRYLFLVRVDREPTTPAGYRWEDGKVIGGAEIAAALADVWKPMRLYCIEPLPSDPTIIGGESGTTPNGFSGRPNEPFFTLVTHPVTPDGTEKRTRVLWGYAPGAKVLGELEAADKVARLKRYFDTHDDSLNGPQGAAQTLDIRTLPPPVSP
jgi:hypothetical protein